MPQAIAGRLAAPAPDRPATASPPAASCRVRGGDVATAVPAGGSMGGLMSLATTMRRFSALYMGWQVVRVRRLSGVSSRTETVSGVTIFFSITLYLNVPARVVTVIS